MLDVCDSHERERRGGRGEEKRRERREEKRLKAQRSPLRVDEKLMVSPRCDLL
jgi:hypothetical protein